VAKTTIRPMKTKIFPKQVCVRICIKATRRNLQAQPKIIKNIAETANQQIQSLKSEKKPKIRKLPDQTIPQVP
jgi:hypothetical protein